MPLARCLIYNAIEGIAVEAGTIARVHYTIWGMTNITVAVASSLQIK